MAVTNNPRRFPPPWTVEEYRDISYIVRDANKFAVAYVSGGNSYAASDDEGRGAEGCSRHRQAA